MKKRHGASILTICIEVHIATRFDDLKQLLGIEYALEACFRGAGGAWAADCLAVPKHDSCCTVQLLTTSKLNARTFQAYQCKASLVLEVMSYQRAPAIIL